MTVILTPDGYEQTKAKLQQLNERLQQIVQRRDLSAIHMAEVRRSYEQMLGQYRQEIKLYEAHSKERHAATIQLAE